ncbi:MAG: CHAP domain-containing protein, partial [Oscillospiraceae bacterium]|nr:CHAP domain-containing protein [Oscillospiraceae bacterium]
MEKRVEGLVRQFKDARRHRLRFEALVTALSVLVTGNVFWQLRRYGTALSESSPETEQPAAGRTLVETDADPPEETARSGIAEAPEDWEAELPVFTDETPQQRIAAIATSQLGYTEGGEIELADVGTSRAGYTRYGAWYGNPYGEWNTMFTYFCMYYAGVEKAEIPYGSGCWAWYETLSEKDMIAPCGNEQIGDILFFDTDSDGEPDRTGIVSGTEEGEQLSVIEGDRDGTVAEVQYLRGGSDMLGVLSADAYIPDLPPTVVLIDYSADSESGIHVDAQAAEGVFPEGTVMRAADVAEDEAIQAAQDTLGENAVLRDAVAVDISFCTADGEEIEPADGNAVSVRISLPAEKQLSGDVYTLVHVDDEGEGQLVADAQVASDGAAFIAESFSVYVLTSNG